MIRFFKILSFFFVAILVVFFLVFYSYPFIYRGYYESKKDSVRDLVRVLQQDSSDTESSYLILRYYKSSDRRIRQMAVDALGEIESDVLDEEKMLIDSIFDKDGFVQYHAAIALRKRGRISSGALEKLFPVFEESSLGYVHMYLARFFSDLDKDAYAAIPILESCLSRFQPNPISDSIEKDLQQLIKSKQENMAHSSEG